MTDPSRPAFRTVAQRPRFGIVGAARIVKKAFLTPASGLVDVACVAARDAERAAAFAAEHGIASAFGSYEELLARPDLDAVYIALPAALHAHWTERALEAGKHVLCEKPFSVSEALARKAVERAQRAGLLLMEAQHWRYHPLVPAFEQALSNLGPLTRIVAHFDAPVRGANIRFDPALGAGVLLDFGCYLVQWLMLASGDSAPEVVAARAIEGPPNVDVAFSAELRSKQGAELHLACDMRPEVTFQAWIEVEGARGTARFDNPLNGEDGSVSYRLHSGASGSAPAPGPTTFRRQLEAFVTALQSGVPPATSGDSIVSTQATLDALIRAAGLPAWATLVPEP